MHVRHVLHARIGKVAAADLGAAFEQVAGHGGGGQAVPVVPGPAEVRHGRPHGQGGVGHAAADHDLRAVAQGIGNAARADIGVGADKARFREGRAHDAAQHGAAGVVREVVPLHHGHAGRFEPKLRRQRADAPRRRARVGRAKVADDGDAVGQAQAEYGRQELVEQRLVAVLGIAAPRQLRQRQRAFGQRLENQRRRATGGNQRAHHGQGGIGAVAGEAGAGADQQGSSHGRSRKEGRRRSDSRPRQSHHQTDHLD
ncbi:hypothetical protein D3C72_1430460 [compost metagenome]